MKARVHITFRFLLIIWCMGACLTVLVGQDSSIRWEVTLDMFSGRPNPVFVLQQSELQEVNRFLSYATSLPADGATTVIHKQLGYRGLHIRQLDTNNALLSQIEVAGREILVQNASGNSLMQGPDNALEKYLVDLALSKGVIDNNLYSMVLGMMANP